jgi:hypothetical protein
MKRRRWRSRVGVGIIALLAMVLPLTAAEPAGASVWCNNAGYAVKQESSLFGATIYWWQHVINMCSDQNVNYWTITQVAADWSNHWDVDSTWSYQGISIDNRFSDYYLGLWTRYTSQREAHFQQCFFFYCNNLYPRVDLHGENSGYLYLDFARNG